MTRTTARFVSALIAVLALVGLAPSAPAQEPLALYEDWSGHVIRGDRWTGGIDSSLEFRKLVEGHRLSLLFRVEGARTDDVGLGLLSNRLAFPAPAAVTAVQAAFKVKEVEVTDCAANPNVSLVRPAAISLNKFNDGTSSGPGNLIGDHVGRVEVSRRADSTDHGGVMRAEGSVLRCVVANCSTVDTVAQVDLGTVRVGHPIVLRIAWDPDNSRFLAARDDGPDLPLPYPPEANAAPPRGPFADIRITARPASCTAEAVVAEARTTVGHVFTNASVVVP